MPKHSYCLNAPSRRLCDAESMVDESSWKPLSDKHYAAIGRVVVESATLEGVLELAIWATEGVDPAYGEEQTGGLNLKQKSDRFFKAAALRFKAADERDSLARLKEASGRALADRRRLVHGFWAFGVSADAPLLVHYREAKKRSAARPKPWTPAEIEAVASEIEAVGDQIIRFLEDRGMSAPLPFNR